MATMMKNITRNDFPEDFVFGCATSAHQVEGSYNAHGKSLNNWDVFSMTRPDKIQDGSNACVAIDHYNRYQEDVMYMKKLGLDAYRFSISWSRVLPGGRLSSGVNREGVQFYNNLIDFCIEKGIKPYATVFHYDVPQCLEDEYGGFLSDKIWQDFVEFAELCFWEFGDRVKYWITQNEPLSFTTNGYVSGSFPPSRGNAKALGRTNPAIREFLATPHRNIMKDDVDRINPGDAGTEPYIVAHNLIIAHAKAVDVYRKKFQTVQRGMIGVTNNTVWCVPLNEKDPKDVAAASRAVDFMWGWFMAPIVHGDYPASMRESVKERLPKFTPEEKKLVQGSYDFIGLNYYTTQYAMHHDIDEGTKPTYLTDQRAAFTNTKDNIPIGENPGSEWLYIVPKGIYNLLKHTKEEYNNPLIYITESGMSTKNDPTITVAEARKDEVRITCYRDHLMWVHEAIKKEGVNVKTYFMWSMFDNWEWTEGYTSRFGIFYVDFVNGLERYPKNSAIWWMNFLKKESKQMESEENATENKSSGGKRLDEIFYETKQRTRSRPYFSLSCLGCDIVLFK